MKKKASLLVCVILLGLFGLDSVRAQGNTGYNLGARFGITWGIDTEISFQMPLGSLRLEADLGTGTTFNISSVWRRRQLTGIVQKTFELPFHFDWYIGMGAQLAAYTNVDESPSLGLCPQVGLEYFIPNTHLQLSADLRPCIPIISSSRSSDFIIAAGLRYAF